MRVAERNPSRLSASGRFTDTWRERLTTRRWRPSAVALSGWVAAAGIQALAGCDDACGASGCAPGAVCRSDGSCGAPASLSEPCEADADCALGLLCFSEWVERTPGQWARTAHCQRRTGELGEPCGTAPRNTGILPCVPGTRCVYSQPVEVSPLPLLDPDMKAHPYWSDTGEAFEITRGEREGTCVADGSLARGAACNEDANCAAGTICNEGYAPPQCQPPGNDGAPCSFNRDCANQNCTWPGRIRPLDAYNCALADPRCDIRLDPSCGYWLTCDVCAPPDDLDEPATPAGDAGADAGSR